MPLPVQWIAVGLGFGYLLHSGSISWKQVGGTLVLLSAAAVYLLWRFQESLLYQPRIFPQHITPKDNPAGMRHPGEHALPWEDVRLTAADGVHLHAWFVRPESVSERKSRATLIFFHENAGNMGLRMENLRLMYSGLGVNVIILSYRGYGESYGTPEEEGMFLDAEATLQWALRRDDVDHNRIVLFGRSLGGGVAIDLASKHEPSRSGLSGELCAVIVENTFVSVSAMVDVVFPFVAFLKRFILRMKWDSVSKIPHITKPILFLSGAQDEIVPASQMSALYAAATGSADKEMALFESGHHNDTWLQGGPEYMRRIKAFLEKHAGPGSHAARRAAL